MSLSRKLMMAGNLEAEPLGTDLDGANDFLSRSSDFSGNADSKTFTFSGWVYNSATGVIYSITSNQFHFFINGDGFNLTANNAATSLILNASINVGVPLATFSHILISIDLADSGNRAVYINDVLTTVTWSTYVNDSIDFTKADHAVGANTAGGSPLLGRLSDVFFDYTYRDLSIESNRRLFTTIDPNRGLISIGGGQLATLSPIFTAFTDPEDQTLNQGTGGAWTVNGTMVRSNRGVNQFNAVASEFDGTFDFLSRAGIGATDGKVFTFHGHINSSVASTNGSILTLDSGLTPRFLVDYSIDDITITAFNSSGTKIFDLICAASKLTESMNILLDVSVDLTSTLKRHVFINGVDRDSDSTWVTYTDDTIDFDMTGPFSAVAFENTGNTFFTGVLGEIFFDTSYIDLAADNPFWDSELNKPKYLGETGELPTGSQPLIYLPIRADSGGNNLGSGGAFSATSSPYTGARGGSEYWARSANNSASSGTGNYLESDSALGESAATGISLVMFVKRGDTSSGGEEILNVHKNGDTAVDHFTLKQTSSEFFFLQGFDSAAAIKFQATTTAFADTDWHSILFNWDGSDGSSSLFIDGVDFSSSITTSNTGALDLGGKARLYQRWQLLAQNFYGFVGGVYLVDSSLDFSDEDIRLLFVDGLSNPLPLQESITNGLIPEGLIRMGFEDVDDLGANSGTGGDFTITGTITAGADVNAS